MIRHHSPLRYKSIWGVFYQEEECEPGLCFPLRVMNEHSGLGFSLLDIGLDNGLGLDCVFFFLEMSQCLSYTPLDQLNLRNCSQSINFFPTSLSEGNAYQGHTHPG